MTNPMGRLTIAGLSTALVLALAVPGLANSAPDEAPIFEIGNDANITGVSKLARSERGIRAVVRTVGLVPGDAYTVWTVVFNNPAACDAGCDGSDLANPDVEGVATLGAGKVVKGDAGTFDILMRAGEALTNPVGAEIHFVIRTHGPALPGLVREQITTLNGGCPPNTCANVLMAKHS